MQNEAENSEWSLYDNDIIKGFSSWQEVIEVLYEI